MKGKKIDALGIFLPFIFLPFGRSSSDLHECHNPPWRSSDLQVARCDAETAYTVTHDARLFDDASAIGR